MSTQEIIPNSSTEDRLFERQPPQGDVIVPGGETAASAAAAQARAIVEAHFVAAWRYPRNWDVVRQRLLKDCERPRFAEAARYRVPRGKKQNARGQWVEEYIEGPSIRFAEAVLRNMGNLDNHTPTVFEDPTRRIVRVIVTDLETNATVSKDVTISKEVERRQNKGRTVLRVRKNAYGDTIYIVEATDDELMEKEARLVSKALRQCVLRLLPADILEEAMETAQATRLNQAAVDPDAARRKILDAFFQLGIDAQKVTDYLGHDTGWMTPLELDDLRGIYAALRDRETTWSEVMEGRREEGKPPKAEGEETAPSDLRAMAEADAATKKKSSQPPKADPKPAPESAAAPTASAAEPGETPAMCSRGQAQQLAFYAKKVFEGCTTETVPQHLQRAAWSWNGGRVSYPIQKLSDIPANDAVQMIEELEVLFSELRASQEGGA